MYNYNITATGHEIMGQHPIILTYAFAESPNIVK